MKTRSNMPLFVVECSDVKALSNSQIDLLRCGDWLVKKDASGEHAYKVTFKSATGMCITYHDASVIETQSYDKVDGNWVYNSEDKTPNLLDAQTENDVKALVEGGTLENAKPIYYHPIYCVIGVEGTYNKLVFQCAILDNNSTAYTNTTLIQKLKDLMDVGAIINVNGYYKDSNNEYADVMVLYKSGASYTSDTFKPTATGTFSFSQLLEEATDISVVDGVNKIN